MTLNNCLFEENGKGSATGPDVISVFGGATVKINNSKFLNNVNDCIIYGFNGTIEVSNSHFEGNTGNIYYGKKKADCIFTTCNFVGSPTKTETKSFYLENGAEVELNDCELGDSTFNDASRVNIVDSTRAKSVGSIFGEGSVAMIVSLLAIVTSGVCIFLIVDMKKKLVPAATNKAVETEDEE